MTSSHHLGGRLMCLRPSCLRVAVVTVPQHVWLEATGAWLHILPWVSFTGSRLGRRMSALSLHVPGRPCAVCPPPDLVGSCQLLCDQLASFWGRFWEGRGDDGPCNHGRTSCSTVVTGQCRLMCWATCWEPPGGGGGGGGGEGGGGGGAFMPADCHRLPQELSICQAESVCRVYKMPKRVPIARDTTTL